MFRNWITPLIIAVLITGCNTSVAPDLTIEPNQSPQFKQFESNTGFYPWGYWDFKIESDGSSAEVIPNRAANLYWGYHMNVVKLLEQDPCTNCLSLSNIHALPNGDVSVDISLRHPFSDRRYTGFDVRGIIIFPGSQYYPDEEMRKILGLEPVNTPWKLRIANHEYGDAELMNPDGWTSAWTPVEGPGSWDYWWYTQDFPQEMPIFQYFPGKFSSGENLSNLNAFKRFHSTEVRHMFEANSVVTRTYVIRPPETGPILASYAVYAHWHPAINIPVLNPATDFPPEANSPLPYEFRVYQDSKLDIDLYTDPKEPEKIHWIIKMWDVDKKYWESTVSDLPLTTNSGTVPKPHPSGLPDEYVVYAAYNSWYGGMPDPVPGDNSLGPFPWLCKFFVRYQDPNPPWSSFTMAMDVYIAQIEYEESDGE